MREFYSIFGFSTEIQRFLPFLVKKQKTKTHKEKQRESEIDHLSPLLFSPLSPTSTTHKPDKEPTYCLERKSGIQAYAPHTTRGESKLGVGNKVINFTSPSLLPQHKGLYHNLVNHSPSKQDTSHGCGCGGK